MNHRIACVIPTFNAGSNLKTVLDSLSEQSVCFDLIAIDSSSADDTVELLNKYTNIVLVKPSHDFNHGGTRQFIVDSFISYDVFVFLTQDAVLSSRDSLKNLLLPFEDKLIGAVNGRQLPNQHASPLARHARLFNYPVVSFVRTLADSKIYGLKTAFLSNSFAAYRSSALKDIGGFPNDVIFAEDMYVAAKMLKSGWKIAYNADATCFHSHNYTLIEEFRRYFDNGVFHSRNRWIRELLGGAGREGIRYCFSELRYLGVRKIHLWPSSIFRNVIKIIAFKLGNNEESIPKTIKISLSMNKRYWLHF